MQSFLRQAAVILGAYAVFLAFVIFIWWAAWRLSLSKVPILRECFGTVGNRVRGAITASTTAVAGEAKRPSHTEGAPRGSESGAAELRQRPKASPAGAPL
mmetsp:Transcript_45137/g.98116  ORF Transcript_45137/g.98116 Transcript_45137/m.98116 type:complete len:100 (-) Transcript_45137:91-390(-)